MKKLTSRKIILAMIILVLVMTFVACSVTDKYTVTFDSNGGITEVTSYTNIESGSKIKAPIAPIKEGYTFLGWYKESGLINKFDFATDTITSNITLYASWELTPIPKYTVTFNTNNGTAVESKTVETGTLIEEPITYRENYKFIGWYKESGLINKFNFVTEPITKDTILYAKWEEFIETKDIIFQPTVDNTAYKVVGIGLNTDNVIRIPISYNGKPVVEIEKNAFKNCNSFTSVIIPKNIVTIGENAFENCRSMVIYAEVKSIPSGWNSNWNVGNYPVIWDYDNNDKDKDGYTYLVKDNITYKVKDITATVYVANLNITTADIPERVTNLDNNYNVIGIDAYAFNSCESLDSITIPNSVIDIGENAFANCDNLIIYAEVASQPSGWLNGWNTSNRPVQWKCKNPEGYEFELTEDKNGYKLIGITVKDGDIVIPYTYNGKPVVAIEKRLLLESENTTSVFIPNSIINIGSIAFTSCLSLQKIVVASDNPAYKSVDGVLYTKDGTMLIQYPAGKTNTQYNIQDNVTIIAEGAFSNCTNLISISIPASVTTINNMAFFYCINLVNVTFGDNSMLASIGKLAFYSCTSLENISIPQGLTIINAQAFAQCTSLVNIIIPKSVETIDMEAFYNCQELESISIPNSVKIIGENAFAGCLKLTSIIFGKESSLQTIGNYAFDICGMLQNIVIPISVTIIGENAFANCNSLTINAEVPSKPSGWAYNWNSSDRPVTWGNNNITNDQAQDYDYIIKGDKVYLTQYKGQDEDIIIPSTIDGKTVVSFGEIFRETNIKTITIPASIMRIDIAAFSDCNILLSVTFGDNSQLVSIGASAFDGCSRLASIEIPSSVTEIGENAFDYCVNLQTIIIPLSVTSIGEYAFANCSALTINAEVAEKDKPSGWADDWNYSGCTVNWNYNNPD